MVQLRKNFLYLIWLVLIIVLFFANWVGIYERYLTASLPTPGIIDVGVGDVDLTLPGNEFVYLTPSQLIVIGEIFTQPSVNQSYYHTDWETNPLVGLSINDFDVYHKGDEIIVLTENGTLMLIHQETTNWFTQKIGNLPSPSPVWTTYALASGQLIANSSSAEIAIVGEHFDWPTQNTTGRVYVGYRVDNVSWQIDEVLLSLNPLFCISIGDVNSTHPGMELLTGGQNTGVLSVAYQNGIWNTSSIYYSSYTIQSISIGNFLAHIPYYDIALIIRNNAYILSKADTGWHPQQIWRKEKQQGELHSIKACDADPYHPGDELLAYGTATITGRSVLLILRHFPLVPEGESWTISILWDLFQPPSTLKAVNFDYSRDGAEVIIGNDPWTGILSVPHSLDRTMRAISTVILPAVILFPATVLLFALADFIGRVSEQRRRNHALQMVTKGFVRCPYCKRFVPQEKLEAHIQWHRKQQFR